MRGAWLLLVLLLAPADWTGPAAAATDGCDLAHGDDAIAACTRVINSGGARGRSLVTAYTVRCFLWNRKKESDRALADCNAAIRLDGKLALGYHGRCWAWNEKKNYDRAIADCSEAIRLDPKHAGAFTIRGLVWSAKGAHDRAMADHDEAIRLDPKVSVFFANRGVSRIYQRDYDRAIGDLNQAVRLDPRNAAAYHNRGVALRNKYSFERAIADATEALRLVPNYIDAFENRGHALRNIGEYNRAIADYDQAIRLDPGFAQAYVGRGLAWAEKREFDLAIADYNAAIRLDPDFAAAFTNRGLAFERKGDREAARADFQAALALPQRYSHSKWAQDTARDRLAVLASGPLAAELPPSASTLPSPPSTTEQLQDQLPPARPELPHPRKDPAANGSGGRVALVIGNASYPDADPPLDLPTKDARALADELKRAGFDVAVGENLTRQQLLDAIDAFKKKIKSDSAALLFYSGYGIQTGRQVYMIPINAQVWAERDVQREGVSVESVLAQISDYGAGVKLVILDASRRNPFERRFRSASSGLPPVAVSGNSLVIYATGLGQVINEAGGEQSLFVRELLKELRSPGATAEEAFNRTRIGVSRASEAEQVPWVSSSLVRSFPFGPPERRGAR